MRWHLCGNISTDGYTFPCHAIYQTIFVLLNLWQMKIRQNKDFRKLFGSICTVLQKWTCNEHIYKWINSFSVTRFWITIFSEYFWKSHKTVMIEDLTATYVTYWVVTQHIIARIWGTFGWTRFSHWCQMNSSLADKLNWSYLWRLQDLAKNLTRAKHKWARPVSSSRHVIMNNHK